MKYTAIVSVLLALASSSSPVRAESEYERNFKQLKDQRTKALAAAAEPINRVYASSLEQLFKRATQAGQVELALEIKKEMQSVSGRVSTPTALFGSWSAAFSDSPGGSYTINSDGTTRAGSDSGAWTVEGNLLLVRWNNGASYRIPLSESGATVRGERKKNANSRWEPFTAKRE